MRRLLVPFALLIAACGAPERGTPDLILAGAKVFTADSTRPWAEAVAIAGDRILAVSSDREIRALARQGTRVIELGGRVVVPGINDAHRHFSVLSPATHRLALTPLEPSWEETRAAIGRAARELPAGTWIDGTVGVAVVTDPSVDRRALDALAPQHPVRLAAFYGHGEIYNSLALAALGVSDTQADPAGGFFERERTSRRINGRVFEYPHWNLQRALSDALAEETIVEGLSARGREVLALGITSVQEMPMIALDRFVQTVAAADLPLRVRAIRFPGTDERGRSAPEPRQELAPPGAGSRVRVSGTKWILDGTPLEWGSAMRAPYRDRPDQQGRLNFPPEEVAAMLRESLAAGDQLLLHAVGDRTIEVVLAAMESMPAIDWPARRVRLEHGDGLLPDLVARAARLGVVVVQNPTHFSLRVIADDRWGRDRGFQPLRSLLAAGVPLALGSDGPPNPWLDVFFAVTHPAAPAEAISVAEAVAAYTSGAAFAEFEEAEKGTVTAGKLADLAVLSQDVFTVPPDALPATRSILTLVGGKIVHDTLSSEE